MKKDNLIYDHFSGSWRDPYTWAPNDKPHKLQSILWGAIAAIGIFAVSLTILCGLLGG